MDCIEEQKESVVLPDICSAADLVRAGIVANAGVLSDWRKKGKGPAFKKIGNRSFIYTREDVVDWLCTQATKNKAKRDEKVESDCTKKQLDHALDRLETVEIYVDTILRRLTNLETHGNRTSN